MLEYLYNTFHKFEYFTSSISQWFYSFSILDFLFYSKLSFLIIYTFIKHEGLLSYKIHTQHYLGLSCFIGWDSYISDIAGTFSRELNSQYNKDMENRKPVNCSIRPSIPRRAHIQVSFRVIYLTDVIFIVHLNLDHTIFGKFQQFFLANWQKEVVISFIFM